jgi:hypothetical protein
MRDLIRPASGAAVTEVGAAGGASRARTGYAPGSAEPVHRRQLGKAVSWTGRERLRCLWYRLRLTVAEMNYATRRMVELQAPWISDDLPDDPAIAQRLAVSR